MVEDPILFIYDLALIYEGRPQTQTSVHSLSSGLFPWLVFSLLYLLV